MNYSFPKILRTKTNKKKRENEILQTIKRNFETQQNFFKIFKNKAKKKRCLIKNNLCYVWSLNSCGQLEEFIEYDEK